MTMVIDSHSRHYGNIGYPDNTYSTHLQPSPQFTDPWGPHSTSPSHVSAYATSVPKQDVSRSLPMTFPPIPASSPSLVSSSGYSGAGFGGSDLLSIPQDISRSNYTSDQPYHTSPQPNNSFSPASYSSLNYAQSLQQQQQQQHDVRKVTEPNEPNPRAEPPSFGELDASRGMLALSHQNLTDLTPRNIYEARNARTSTDGYGFPSSQSLHSSISTASHRDSFPYYSSASVASGDSATDYSSAASDAGYDSVPPSRTLPRPSQLVGANLGPPAPQSMMSQFSSKMSPNTQKKHKCKVCDKRFTRPSSLQTHMYSHTGEKPFACTVERCGRHFSVVSNLRRHQKVHKDESVSSHSDDDD